MKLVIIESPYRGEVLRNEQYARRALHHSITEGEAPFASHLLYTQKGILNDAERNDRELGIRLGLAWSHVADLHVFYTDRGWSSGMLSARDFCRRTHQTYEYRALDGMIQLPEDELKQES